jgi:hypothetical protein
MQLLIVQAGQDLAQLWMFMDELLGVGFPFQLEINRNFEER